MDAFLRELREAGTHESSGQFTLDLVEAASKLGEFQLFHPGAWWLRLVQALVQSGASSIRLGLGWTLQLHAPGAFLQPPPPGGWVAAALGHADWAVRDLLGGFLAALPGVDRIDCRMLDGNGTCVYCSATPEKGSMQVVPGSGPRETVIEVRRREIRREHELLPRISLLPVRMLGVTPPQLQFPANLVAMRLVVEDQPERNRMSWPMACHGGAVYDQWGIPEVLTRRELFRMRPYRSVCAGVLGVAEKLDWRQGDGWLLPVRAGVALQPVLADLGVPGACAMVCIDGSEVSVDLSGIQLRVDDALRRFVRDLRGPIRDLARAIPARIGAWQPEFEHSAVGWAVGGTLALGTGFMGLLASRPINWAVGQVTLPARRKRFLRALGRLNLNEA